VWWYGCERLICAVEGEWYGWRWTYWRKEVVSGVERRSGWMGKLAAPMWVEESEDCRQATIWKRLDEDKWMVAL